MKLFCLIVSHKYHICDFSHGFSDKNRGGEVLGVLLSELEEGSKITLVLSAKGKLMALDATIKKHVKRNIAIISIKCDTTKKLNFSTVQVDMEYQPEDSGVPIIWHNVKIAGYKTEYALQVFSEGVKHNRRDSFRVGISVTAKVNTLGRGPRQVMIRDLSLSGFSISDRKKELKLSVGDELSVSFDDLGHKINLTGRVVRVEEQEEVNIFGFVLCNLCKDLSSYLSVKQRQKK